jgi:hypothetical protein
VQGWWRWWGARLELSYEKSEERMHKVAGPDGTWNWWGACLPPLSFFSDSQSSYLLCFIFIFIFIFNGFVLRFLGVS